MTKAKRGRPPLPPAKRLDAQCNIRMDAGTAAAVAQHQENHGFTSLAAAALDLLKKALVA